jgi:hypothetical protein
MLYSRVVSDGLNGLNLASCHSKSGRQDGGDSTCASKACTATMAVHGDAFIKDAIPSTYARV